MYVLLDLSLHNTIRIVLFGAGESHEYAHEGRNKELLAVLVDTLQTKDMSTNDVQGIAVLVGEGGFTSTRLAVTIANTIAYANDIPVIGVGKEECNDLSAVATRLADQPPGVLLSATYSGMPNIGPKKT